MPAAVAAPPEHSLFWVVWAAQTPPVTRMPAVRFVGAATGTMHVVRIYDKFADSTMYMDGADEYTHPVVLPRDSYHVVASGDVTAFRTTVAHSFSGAEGGIIRFQTAPAAAGQVDVSFVPVASGAARGAAVAGPGAVTSVPFAWLAPAHDPAGSAPPRCGSARTNRALQQMCTQGQAPLGSGASAQFYTPHPAGEPLGFPVGPL